MGLRGAGARKRSTVKATKKGVHASWKRKRTPVARVIAFLESLPITKGIRAGKKMRLLPGQRKFVEDVYGRVSKDGRRKIRIAIKREPRGNGKTGLLAGLALCHLLGPECEPRGEIYSAAYNKLQAALIFAEMKAIIEAVPDFEHRCNLQRYGKVIEVLSGDGAGSVYESLSADDKRAHGLAPSFWVFDEFAQAPNADLLDNLRTAMGKRSQALGVIISTQAANDQHPLSQMIDDAKLGVDPSVYLQLAVAPDDADIFDEETWFACNEALGKFLDLNEFRSQAAQAKRLPSFRAKFENLRLNKRIDANVQFISDADWMACAAPLDMAELVGRPCHAGLDLSQTTDMSALVLYWPHNGAVLPFFWLPDEGLLDRDRKEGGHYRRWRDAGLLETTPGKAINFKAIIRRLAEINAEYQLVAVAYDRAFIKTFNAQCAEEGIELPMEEFGQGFVSMAQPVQLLEAAVLDRRIHHGGHPILRWQISNIAIEMDPAGNRKPSKRRAVGHIDGAVSLLMAMGSASRTPPKRRSVYEERGILTIE
ncbi:terminase TerL endonuclease subunit [Bradyrhizobium sp. Gha]|uniref:terminase large subunit n=1 Tax=Bradyrhizobium sp. Gha TaxID=1855318 RepID=UPI0008E38275|nr:terminase TerL endonuclease subunit [Bradyrhizobium sp. Gha]SFJ25570.1 Phage terminase-like protein, large subunit, contains N-terminal HTH domain [Bradyrhizobium sp. Gha]